MKTSQTSPLNPPQNQNSLWEVSVQYEGQDKCLRRFHGPSLKIGASPKAQIKVPQPAPEFCFKAEKFGNEIEVWVNEGTVLEFHVGGKWVKKESFKGSQIPELRYNDALFQIREVSSESFHFHPLTWASRFAEGERHALWHFRGDVLIETILVEKNKQKTTMKCGYEFIWNSKKSNQITLKSQDGQIHSLPLEEGPKESLRARLGQDVFFFTALPDEASVIPELPLLSLNSPSPEISKFTKGMALFWILFVLLMQFLPKPGDNLEKEVKLESIGTDLPSISLENHKNPGGNGHRGGGGVEHVASKDSRGGQGHQKSLTPSAPLQSYKAAQHSKPIGAQGSHLNHQKSSTVLAKKSSSTLKTHAKSGAGNEFIGAPKSGIFSAVASLDAGIKSGRVQGESGSGAVAVGGGVDPNGRDGVLGTLGKMKGGSGGGGLGLGGLGTKGFGGGGGGGSGPGFGTGIGEGLGEGHGTRQIAFGTGGTLVRGGLEKSEIDAVVQENLSQIRYCYNIAIRTNPKLQGKVIAAFTIGAGGRVVSSRVKNSNLRSPDVEGCIASRIASWTFPKPRGGGEVGVTYPFLLRAN